MDRYKITIINMALALIVLVFIGVEYRWIKSSLPKPAPEKPPVEVKAERPSPIVDGRFITGPPSEAPRSEFERIFTDNAPEDVGGNLPAAWRNMPDEHKADTELFMDKEIKRLERHLRMSPEDKKAKHKLKISKMLKKLMKVDFDPTKLAEKTAPTRD